MTIESSVQQIQQRLTCPVCLDSFKQPKLLPCQHTFCLSPCLTNLVDRITRRIKCPECRMIHNLPLQGVDSLPNNITIQRFLDLDLRNITTGTAQTSSISTFSNKNNLNNSEDCFQCQKKHLNYFKCLDCEKFLCQNCKTVHMSQLKNECKQNNMNLRRNLPKLSERVGN
jgi:tripartite motif-containing protein 71